MLAHRLKPLEVQSILESIRSIVPASALYSVSLFGSRANPSAKGGDIDLWLFLESESQVDLAWVRRIRGLIQDRLGEQKIDIVISGPDSEIVDPRKKAFLQQVSSTMVELWRKSPQPR